MLLKWMAFYMAFCTCNNISRGQIHLNGIAGSKGICISLKDIANLSFIICTNLHQINAKFPLFDYCQSDRQKVLILCLEFVLLLCIRMNIFYKLKIHLYFFLNLCLSVDLISCEGTFIFVCDTIWKYFTEFFIYLWLPPALCRDLKFLKLSDCLFLLSGLWVTFPLQDYTHILFLLVFFMS